MLNEAPTGSRPRFLLPVASSGAKSLRSESSSLSSSSLRSRFFAKGDKILVDTNIVVEMLRGNEKAKVYLENKPYISVVTEGELICGVKNKQMLEVVKKTIDFFPVIYFDKRVSRKSTELLWKYRLSHGLEILDSLIAATAIVGKYTLVTMNVKDFQYIEGLGLVKWE